MNRPAPRRSRKLEALLDERDDLHIRISLEADRADPDVEKLMAMSRRLARVENEIVSERSNASAEAPSEAGSTPSLRPRNAGN